MAGTRWGRGISVVGAQNVFIRGFQVADTDSAGVYIATEGSPYFTTSVQSVAISNGSITNANTNRDVVQGALLVNSSNAGTSVQNVKISDVAIAATPRSADRNVGVLSSGGSLSGISLDNIRISDSALPPIDSDAPPGSYTATGWTVAGKPANVG